MAFYATQKWLLKARLPKHAIATVLTHLFLQHAAAHTANPQRRARKPNLLFRQYKNYRMLIRLRNWKMTSQATSMMEAHYAREPRDPE